MNYWETYAPVVKWTTIRLVMTLIMSNEWKSRQLDFVLAYPQANVEGDIYMRMPHGVQAQRWQRSQVTHTQTNKEHIWPITGRESVESTPGQGTDGVGLQEVQDRPLSILPKRAHHNHIH